MKRGSVHKLALLAMLLALAVALGVADYYIPFPLVPGAKLGLANIVVLIALYELGITEAALIDLGRVFIVSLITGRLFQMGFFMSLGGAVASLGMMILLKFVARKMTIIGVSACASLTHGFAQVAVYCLFVQNLTAFYYYPVMSLIGIATGILIGILAERIILTKVIAREKEQYGFNQTKKKPKKARQDPALFPEKKKTDEDTTHSA